MTFYHLSEIDCNLSTSQKLNLCSFININLHQFLKFQI